MVKMLICAAGLAILCGCGTVQKVDVGAITRDVKSVSFVQNGKQPAALTIGLRGSHAAPTGGSTLREIE